MKHLIIIFLIVVSFTQVRAMAQQDSTVNRNRAQIDNPYKFVLIPINRTQTAYYTGTMNGSKNMLIVNDTELANVISKWYDEVWGARNYAPVGAFRVGASIKPYHTATKKDIKRITDMLMAHLVNMYSIQELSDEEKTIVANKL